MTYVESETLTCPGCGKKAIARIHTTLNVTVDPELREALFNSQINQFQCPSCGSQATIVAPLMYHDMEREFAIQFYLEHFMDDEEFYARFDNDPLTRNDDLALISTDKMPRYLYSPHIVFDIDELKRYIVFRERLFEKGRTQRR